MQTVFGNIMALAVFFIFVLLLWALVSTGSRKKREIKVHDAYLTCEELEKHAREMAIDHTLSRRTSLSYWPLPRMNDSYRLIMSVYRQLNEDIKGIRNSPPAAEWLLDNFYIIEEQVKNIRRDLTKKLYLSLPALKCGHLRGYARIYSLALELISHTNGRVDDQILVGYIKAYQSHSPLLNRELWSLGIMLRVALIENIRYICEKINETQTQWLKADLLADLLHDCRGPESEKHLQTVEMEIKALTDIYPSFFEHLSFRVRKMGKVCAPVLRYLDDKLAKHGTNIEDITHKEHNDQAVRKGIIENCIMSLKFISSLDWVEVFESLSQVEDILRQDPADTYARMDFASRSLYRRKIEELAELYQVSESHISHEIIELASEYRSIGETDKRLCHVGYYIIGEGVNALDRKMGYHSRRFIRLQRFLKRHAGIPYFGLIGVITLSLVILGGLYAYRQAPAQASLFFILAMLVLVVPASDIAVVLVNWLLIRLYKPSILPKLELKEGIPASGAAFVVIPALLSDAKRAVELLEHLEVHYLANRYENLYFAILGDFRDSPAERAEEDGLISDAALKKVLELNKRYAGDGKDIFYFFCRHRLYNDRQQKWMGWERKRGALAEFNQMLLDSGATSYTIRSAVPSDLPAVRYVITLDADTILPLGTAKKLIGTMLHPLNTPVVDSTRRIVTKGYGLIQPRIGIEMESANRSLFSRIYAGENGLDPYSCAVSDVYQDLFGEGIFTGKGIYDLQTFHQVLGDAIPDNAVLSHDLLEGSHVRTGLATDLELVDGYPSRYNSYASRLHRWVRGDWQLLPWLFPQVRNRYGRLIRNPLSGITRWKIIDNLRRSLVAPSLMLLIALGFCLLPGSAWFWLAAALITTGLPLLTGFVDYFLSKGFSSLREKRHVPVIRGLKAKLLQTLLQIMLLPHQAWLMLHAICITLGRVLFTRRNLLEWVTAADVEREQKNTPISYWRKMKMIAVEAVLIAGLAWFFKPYGLPAALVMLCLWLSSPHVAWWISLPIKEAAPGFTPGDLQELRIYARKTWRYFEEFCNARNHFLAPDNYQEDPPNGIAYRTSPTNIGLGLLSVLSARDLGYVGMMEMQEMLSRTLSTIERLDKWEGHLYNWYETHTLQTLRPRYISTVDSGNFIGYLMTLKQGLLEYLDRPLLDAQLLAGLSDTLHLALREKNNPPAVTLSLERTQTLDISGLMTVLEQLEEWSREPVRRKNSWKGKVHHLAEAIRRDLAELVPWVAVTLKAISAAGPEAVGNLPAPLHRANELLETGIPLNRIAEYCSLLENEITAFASSQPPNTGNNTNEADWLEELRSAIRKSDESSHRFLDRYHCLIDRLEALVKATEFRPLYNEKKQLFSIGYNMEENRLTNSYYDLLASEARQASFLAIARGEVEASHWFRLGRTLTTVDHYKGLVSWSGTMFEYLMPMLVMRTYPNTLMDETYRFVVRSQKKYGRQRQVPWGTSESGFYSLDVNLDYQYKALGVPWLGLKRGLVEDMVVAPYATMLALTADPASALENLRKLAQEGMSGPYGFYEAIDYTPEHLPMGMKSAIIKSYMAHHQGMSLVSMNNFLTDNIMQKRFHADPVVKAAQLLLQEKVPSNIVFTKENKEKITPFKDPSYEEEDSVRTFGFPSLVLPKTHILANGTYSVMVTDSGTGYSRGKFASVTRWREDAALDRYGTFFYIRDLKRDLTWSSTFKPAIRVPDRYHVTFTSGEARFTRFDGDLETQTQVIVCTGDNAEIRRVSVTNHGSEARSLDVTSYLEVVLGSHSADVAHPAFGNLFIRTEYIPESQSLLASRKPRSEKEKELWMVHAVVVEGEPIGGVQYETDRMQFIGRGRSISNPAAIVRNRPLSNTVGPVLDPVMCLRQLVHIGPRQTARLSYITAIGDSREGMINLAEKYSTPGAVSSAFKMTITRSRVEARYLNLKTSEIEEYQDIIPHLLFIGPLQRVKQDCLTNNRKGQSSLWPYGISGDLPVVLVQLDKADQTDIVYEALKAHEYWRTKDLKIDLVILNEEENSYSHPLHNLLSDILSSSYAHDVMNKPGGVFSIRGSSMPEEDRTLLCAVSRFTLRGDHGSLADQLKILEETAMHTSPTPPSPEEPSPVEEADGGNILYAEDLTKTSDLLYFNGLGGFTPDGREYVVILQNDQHTPLPWSNVVANPRFGFIATESGGGYTWFENSRENKLSPWSNDPVSDIQGEILYLGDEATGKLWSITALPLREREPYQVRHGFGYTVYRHNSHGIGQELTQFVPVEDGLKVNLVKLKNLSSVSRSLTVTHYVRPVLGVGDQSAAWHLLTRQDASGALLVSNPYNEEFKGMLAFIKTSEEKCWVTGDRREFFGQGTPAFPAGIYKRRLSGATGAGLDPCAAVQTLVELQPGEEKELVFVLGMSREEEEMRRLYTRYCTVSGAKAALEETVKNWLSHLQTFQVSTPDMSLNILLNGWLMYQVVSCRIWARSGFYQSGGAYGFRDQLQDSMAVAHVWPQLVRNQILLHSRHQFPEGDVQHWWHEPDGKGTRTRFSDDLLWMPFVTAEYIRVTGDAAILHEETSFVESEPLRDFEDERYTRPTVSSTTASIYEHCIRAIDRSLSFGEHGLPLMGSGDWNDGMNTVGNRGKGESVWLAWFLYSTLNAFAPLCIAHGDKERGQQYIETAEAILQAIEQHAWDGGWYRRAYFDNGLPLGSVHNSECKIDSISQSWSVISGGGNPERVHRAMDAVESYLIRWDDGLIKLLTPPFDEGDLEPGYIKGYVPGVRENGGQYTHAAAWVILAYTRMGQGDRALQLYGLINPINHTRTPLEYSKYKAEPYVMAADVYAAEPHTGRGGWTWYTGSAGWMYRVGIESILGLQKSGDSLFVNPCIPGGWKEFDMTYRYGGTTYHIHVSNPEGTNQGVKEILLDGALQDDMAVKLTDDNRVHQVEVKMGR